MCGDALQAASTKPGATKRPRRHDEGGAPPRASVPTVADLHPGVGWSTMDDLVAQVSSTGAWIRRQSAVALWQPTEGLLAQALAECQRHGGVSLSSFTETALNVLDPAATQEIPATVALVAQVRARVAELSGRPVREAAAHVSVLHYPARPPREPQDCRARAPALGRYAEVSGRRWHRDPAHEGDVKVLVTLQGSACVAFRSSQYDAASPVSALVHATSGNAYAFWADVRFSEYHAVFAPPYSTMPRIVLQFGYRMGV